MASIDPKALRAAFAKALADSDPKAAARAEQLIRESTEQLDTSDTSARAEVQRGITQDSIDRNQSN